jgi:hypothetical protein
LDSAGAAVGSVLRVRAGFFAAVVFFASAGAAVVFRVARVGFFASGAESFVAADLRAAALRVVGFFVDASAVFFFAIDHPSLESLGVSVANAAHAGTPSTTTGPPL